MKKLYLKLYRFSKVTNSNENLAIDSKYFGIGRHQNLYQPMASKKSLMLVDIVAFEKVASSIGPRQFG